MDRTIKYGPPKKIVIDCSKVHSTSDLARMLNNSNVTKYIYGLHLKHTTGVVRHLKWGRGSSGYYSISDDRIARQVEGAHGWGKNYMGTSALVFRDRCEKSLGFVPHKDDLFIEVFDFTPHYLQLNKDYSTASYNVGQRFIEYKEAERIHWDVQNDCVGPLNVDIPKFTEGSFEKELQNLENFNSLFEVMK